MVFRRPNGGKGRGRRNRVGGVTRCQVRELSRATTSHLIVEATANWKSEIHRGNREWRWIDRLQERRGYVQPTGHLNENAHIHPAIQAGHRPLQEARLRHGEIQGHSQQASCRTVLTRSGSSTSSFGKLCRLYGLPHKRRLGPNLQDDSYRYNLPENRYSFRPF